MKESKYIVDLIGEVVEQVRATYEAPAGYATGSPFYLYGHPLEIANTLTEWSKNPNQKFEQFPLIILFQDFEERKGTHQGENSVVSLNMVICCNTDKHYKSNERYEKTFKTVLYPLYDLFIEALTNSGYFAQTDDLIPHTKIDRVYYGNQANTANLFNDFIDAIEIKDLELTILNNFKNT